MLCEIEFLAVGEASRPGDAIIVRYGSVDNYELMVVDGGTAQSGKNLITHLKKHFGKNVSLAHVVLTHSDADHASGLREVLREIPVANLWLHIPWLLSSEARHLFKRKDWTEEGLRNVIRKEYDIISEIVDLGVTAKCIFHYPFAGETIGPFHVLSPTRYAYIHLLPQFDKTPDADQELIEANHMWIGKQSTGILSAFFDAVVAEAQKWIDETWENERLKDGGVTGASNEFSVVLYGAFDNNHRVLLTGDGGVNALTRAADCADASNLPLQKFTFVQIPHHGSRRNVGPTILNRILGQIQAKGSNTRFTAFVSAPKEDDTHPRKMVLNAFIRRGATAIATQGTNMIHYGGFPKRDDYEDVTPLPFSSKVEDYD